MKYIKYTFLALLIAVVTFFSYGMLFPSSPGGNVVFNSDNATFEVEYSRPYKKGRLIFGKESDDALVPYAKYWRTGANAATTFSTSEDISFAGELVKAGKYSLYTIPGKDSWVIALNSVNDTFFAIAEADQANDVLRVTLSSSEVTDIVEQFTIDFSNDSISSYMDLKWDKTLVSIPLK